MPMEPTKNALFDSTFVALLITAAAYAVAFSFETGFLSFYNIPAELAQVELRSLLLCAAVAGAVVSSLFWTLNVMPMLIPRRFDPLFRVVLAEPLIAGGFLGTLGFLFGLESWIGWLVIMFFPCMLLVINSLLPFASKDQKTYLEKVAAYKRPQPSPADDRMILARLADRFGQSTVLNILGFLMLCGFAYALGVYDARSKSAFLMYRSHVSCVVVRVYGGLMLCARIDEESGTLLGDLRIVETAGADLELRKLGRLHNTKSDNHGD
jgi:hypothetical protein